METLKLIALKLTMNVELEEFLPIISVYSIPVENTRKVQNNPEYVFTYPFEIEHLLAFKTLVNVATKIPSDFENALFEYLWNLTALDELIECCAKNTPVIQFFANFTSELKNLIKTLEKDSEIMNALIKNKGNAIEYEVIVRDKSMNRFIILLSDSGKVIQKKPI